MSVDLITITWICFFAGSLLVCYRNTLRAGWLVLLAAYVLALITHQISIIGIGCLAVTAALLYFAKSNFTWLHIGFIAMSLLLFLHKLPGFNNLLVFDQVVLSANGIPFTMYLNLDKPFVGFILFTVYRGWYKDKPVKSALIPLLAISLICLGAAFTLHFIAWDPKWPPLGWLWALNNLLLVVVAEEAFFRGYLQDVIMGKWLKPKQALFVAAVLFGLAHFAGGPSLILLATIAGCGYGWAYQKGGILASILTHFTFNALHFFLFTYPAIKQSI